MLKKTPLYDSHKELSAKMVPFAGWEMPLQYNSIIDEHKAVREDVGVFDVSHMRAIDIQGDQVQTYLQYLLANDISKLKADGQALYGCMLNEQGGVMDDLITYRLSDNHYRLIVNAATTEKDHDWIQTQAIKYDLTIHVRYDLAMLAIQGPKVWDKIKPCFPENVYQEIVELKYFTSMKYQDLFIARTGYTGEQGIEILLPNDQSAAFWQALLKQGVHPIGLGARDTLRLEAGLNLYGQDMDDHVTPLESNLSWTVDLKNPDRNFIGKDAILSMKEKGGFEKLVALVLREKGVLRPGMKVYSDQTSDTSIGKLTSGTFSPTLSMGIGFARVTPLEDTTCYIEVRGKRVPAKLVKPPFVKQGKANF